MNGIFLNISMQLVAIMLVFLIVKKKKLSFKNDIGFIFPKLKDLFLWFLAFVILIFIEEFITRQNGDSNIDSWIDKYSMSQMLLRIFAIVLLAPISEELLFRGLIYSRIKNTTLKNVGAIVVPAIIFALIHIQYSEFLSITFIFIDGLFYGLARHYSKSVVLAIMLHAFSNLGAILERLT